MALQDYDIGTLVLSFEPPSPSLAGRLMTCGDSVLPDVRRVRVMDRIRYHWPSEGV